MGTSIHSDYSLCLGKETCCLIYIQTDIWTQEYTDEEN